MGKGRVSRSRRGEGLPYHRSVLLPAVLLLAAPADDRFEQVARPFVRAYCADCHGIDEQEGDLSLTGYASPAAVRADPEVWDLVRERVALHEMPPRRSDQPADSERTAFLAWLTDELSQEEDDEPLDPGRPVLRRLNNAQYENAIRDLFGVHFPARERFPSDAIGHGFDTVGESLAMPQLRLEKLLEAAERIATEAIAVHSPPRTVRLQPEDLGGRGGVSGDFFRMPYGEDVTGELDLPRPGRYLMRMHLGASQAGDEPARVAFVVAGRELHQVDVPELPGDARTHEHEVTLDLGGRVAVAARFLNDFTDPEAPDPERRDRNLYVGWIEVEGPLDPTPVTAFQAGLLQRHGPELGRGREEAILTDLVRRVWRRPASRAELGRLARLPEADAPLDARLRLQLAALLASPNFLYLVERDPSGASGVRTLSDHELAARLAAFLWSSVPDRRLDALADAGELSDPAVYEAVVRDMLADPRAEALGEDFALQWLGLRALDEVRPDPERFPTWSDQLAAAMREETLRVFQTVLREGRSVWELLEADWTFVDDTLAAHYGLPAAEGGGFRRVSLKDTPRRGLLGHASVLTVTSDPTRTSPVKRGKWVLEALLAAPPPAPPPGADSLPEEDGAALTARSMRERLEEHRASTECAVCHDRMDPLGFGLEPFDAVGRWRELDGDLPIDATGALPDGRSFDGPAELARVLRGDERFLRAVAEKLYVYALGRGLERGDRRQVAAVLAALDPEQPGLADLVLEVARSEAFRTKRVGE